MSGFRVAIIAFVLLLLMTAGITGWCFAAGDIGDDPEDVGSAVRLTRPAMAAPWAPSAVGIV